MIRVGDMMFNFIVNSLERLWGNKCNADSFYGKVVVTSLHG
jgi:hypothetical protein